MNNTVTIRSRAAKRQDAAKVYAAVFSGAPCPFLVLSADWEIVAGNPAYLTATGRSADSLAGRFMFDAFPDNPNDPLANGMSNLVGSLETAARWGSRDLMPLQRYDVRDERDNWQMRYWKPANWPVLEDGRLLALVHHVVDLTEPARAQLSSPRSNHLGLADRAELAADAARRQRLQVSADMARAEEASLRLINRDLSGDAP